MAVLIIAEHDHNTLSEQVLKTVNAASFFKEDIHILIAGHHCEKVANQAAQIKNVTKILIADHETYSNPLAETLTPLIQSLIQDYNYLLAPSTTFGKNLLPRIAALNDVMQISDVIEIINKNTFKRPFYAGNAIMTVESCDSLKVMTIRTAAFAKADNGNNAPIENLSVVPEKNELSFYINASLSSGERPELTSAKIVVSGGRGMQSKENFVLIEKLADQLNAAIGASRAAVDAGFVPNDYQVGQTGKIVAPELYIAIGISGAIQHLAGMKDSKVIVAINKDEDAPIFQMADYGLVGDLFEIIPELEKELKKIGYH